MFAFEILPLERRYALSYIIFRGCDARTPYRGTSLIRNRPPPRYALSYIPFGRQLATKFLKPILKVVCAPPVRTASGEHRSYICRLMCLFPTSADSLASVFRPLLSHDTALLLLYYSRPRVE